MGNWIDAIVFGVALVAFALGLASIIMAGVGPSESGQAAMKNKVEYGFFGVTGLVLCVLFLYAL
ncbi:hypothetical protein HMF8227_00386 [Saliniradius amylolyticus]|uniref:Uncharacterized protein n=1 Tax=Saliniradius amylolyticus TaxID=2183582 RepID=A0A2S2E028_9ALTE|nr:hypothetical protein [Saliniradius amylolyticus]AWL10892.1 hypothetical protein HMF8227_00386 [Saliniradius amylolyticus]